MKILNLYACLGGNRYKWNEVLEGIEVTAVELDSELCRMYSERFPNDTVICADAHQYLLDHYQEYDFIWSSPPCPTHSRIQHSMKTTRKMQYPDMSLYQQIILLQEFYDGLFVVENVIPFYTPLIPAKQIGRHLFWANFRLPVNHKANDIKLRKQNDITSLEAHHEIDLTSYSGKQDKRKIGRNLVHFDTGKAIFEAALGVYESKQDNQLSFF